MIVGAYTDYRFLNTDDLEIFREATKCFVGAQFFPVLVATQVVSGTNYHFICNAFSITKPKSNYIAQVTIYKPLPTSADPSADITDICKMSCQ